MCNNLQKLYVVLLVTFMTKEHTWYNLSSSDPGMFDTEINEVWKCYKHRLYVRYFEQAFLVNYFMLNKKTISDTPANHKGSCSDKTCQSKCNFVIRFRSLILTFLLKWIFIFLDENQIATLYCTEYIFLLLNIQYLFLIILLNKREKRIELTD